MSSITIVSNAPNCGVTYDHLYDDRNSFIIQATGSKPVKQEVNGTMILPPLVFPGVINCDAISVVPSVKNDNKKTAAPLIKKIKRFHLGSGLSGSLCLSGHGSLKLNWQSNVFAGRGLKPD